MKVENFLAVLLMAGTLYAGFVIAKTAERIQTAQAARMAP